jgi:hypothetical protein
MPRCDAHAIVHLGAAKNTTVGERLADWAMNASVKALGPEVPAATDEYAHIDTRLRGLKRIG